MKIISPRDKHNWITAIICNRWIQAKVYDLPSTFGINNGRISKLSISKTNSHDDTKPFFDQMDYSYDRGEAMNNSNINKDVLNSIISELEAL